MLEYPGKNLCFELTQRYLWIKTKVGKYKQNTPQLKSNQSTDYFWAVYF